LTFDPTNPAAWIAVCAVLITVLVLGRWSGVV